MEQLRPAIAAANSVRIGHIAEPQVHERCHQRLDRIIAWAHSDCCPFTAFTQRVWPWAAVWHDLPPQSCEHTRFHK